MDPLRTFDRRDFLRTSMHVATLAAGIAAAGLALEGCASTSDTAPTTTTTLRPPTTRDWTRLASLLSGSLILPSNPTYQLDRLLYNARFVDLRPQAIAYCATPDDVARCVDFATSHLIELTSRSGGHSYGGYSSCPGLVLDVSRMASVRVDTSSNIATVGAGAKLIDIYNTVGNAGRLLPGGSCPTVGIAGLALGGGVGVFGRKFGLTSDTMRSVHAVTADARLVKATNTRDSDLLWASQGGGGGNFAVATSFEFNVFVMPEVTLFTLQYPWEAAPDMLEGWQHWVSGAPDELWSNCLLLAEGTSGYLAQVSGVFCGSTSELASVLAPLRSDIATAPSASFIGSNDYISAMEIEAGCSGLSIASCHLAPEGQLSREAYSAKSSYVKAPLTLEQVSTIVQAVVHLKSVAPTIGGGLAFDAYGGVINRVAPDATAFVHRDALACIQATYSWSAYTSSAERTAGAQWLTWLGEHVFDASTGAYQNYIDPTLDDWETAYYGSNFTRLTKVKTKYDPDNLFRFAQSIPTSS
jgi:hypothetical protein